MKKLSIVLLALLLAGGFAAAAAGLSLDGEVEANFGLDFENENYGFYHEDTTEFGLTWTSEPSSSGEGDIYAVIEWVDIEISTETLTEDKDLPNSEFLEFEAEVGDLEAKIVGPDWEVVLSSPTDFGNAAGIDMDEDVDTDSEDAWSQDFDFTTNAGTGLTAIYQGVSASVNFWNDEYAFSAGYSTELAEGVTVGGNIGLSDTEDFAGSVTASYAMDMLTVDAAMDFLIGDHSEDDFGLDASVSASTTPVEDVTVDLDAYFENITDGNDGLDVFGKVAYAGIEDVDLRAWGYLNDSNNADPNAEATDSEEVLEAWEFGMDASYVYDIYTPYVSLGYDADEEFNLEVGADVAIIDNAAVNVNYSTDDIANDIGGLNASVTVAL